jgi:hypothetical protein
VEKLLLAKSVNFGMLNPMSSVAEIESALRRLSVEERREIARWLIEELEERDPASQGSGDDNGKASAQPDYAARRRRIFGSKVLPNMVLAARAEERW